MTSSTVKQRLDELRQKQEEEYRSYITKKRWSDPEFRARHHQGMLRYWQRRRRKQEEK